MLSRFAWDGKLKFTFVLQIFEIFEISWLKKSIRPIGDISFPSIASIFCWLRAWLVNYRIDICLWVDLRSTINDIIIEQLGKRHGIIPITWACPVFPLASFIVALVGINMENCDMQFLTPTFAFPYLWNFKVDTV